MMMNPVRLTLAVNTVHRKIFATEKFRESLPKRGAEIFATKIFAKATLIHCVIHNMASVCGARRIFDSGPDEPSQYYTPSRVYSAWL